MNSERKIEYGDFQTPQPLAEAVVALLRDAGISPSVIVEPTCGLGAFVFAALKLFRSAGDVFAYDIDREYVSGLRKALRGATETRCHVAAQDFFSFDWKAFFAVHHGEILVLGNPPWATNAALGALGSANLPEKTNFQGHNGFAAKTGKANFDISEWMLIKLLESLDGRKGCLAMLCKTATARKVLRHGWIHGFNIGRATVHLINSAEHFGVSVSACLLVVHTGVPNPSPTAGVYSNLSFEHRLATLGLVGGELVADVDEYNRLSDLDGSSYYAWRSGVKHDAASVMELRKDGGHYSNGLGERVEIEPTYTFPFLKSSDLANGKLSPNRYLLVTQRKPGDDTAVIEQIAPMTWSYLLGHANALDNRQSIIYRKRPRFSVFGVGDYTFAPWKVAVSGLYKTCRFQVVGPHNAKPVVFDDTCYFVPCASEKEASLISHLLNSDLAKLFLHSLVFFDAKRPLTIDVLNRIDLKRLSERLGMESELRNYLPHAAFYEGRKALLVFEEAGTYSGHAHEARRKRSRK
jgi:hypothetical protein